MITLSESKYDKRPFVYFDIISWLDSKIENKTVGEVIKGKVGKADKIVPYKLISQTLISNNSL